MPEMRAARNPATMSAVGSGAAESDAMPWSPLAVASVAWGCTMRRSSKALAPAIAGPASKNEKRAACSRDRPASMPAEIEKPEREPPGIKPRDLAEADVERAGPRELLRFAGLGRQALDEEEHEAGDEQPDRRDHRYGEERIQSFLEQVAEHGQRQRAEDDEQREPLAALCPAIGEAREETRHKRPVIAREIHEHRQERAEMQHDDERQAGRRPSEQRGDEQRVRRAADGEQLGDALDQAERDRLEEAHALAPDGRPRAVE